MSLRPERLFHAWEASQGVAWDRSQPGIIDGIFRATKKEIESGGSREVTVTRPTEST